MQHPDVIVSRTTLEQHIWNMACNNNSNLIDVYIRRLRANSILQSRWQ
jgi:DNA-binding response OmpR family regulator